MASAEARSCGRPGRKALSAFLVACLLAAWLAAPAWLRAQGAPTAAPTSTPDAEGVIYVIVQPEDSLWSLAARAGIPLQELLDLNEMSRSDIIQPGQRLVLGHGQVATTPTAAAVEAPPPALPPSPSPPPPRTAICVSAYNDANQNGVHDAQEPYKGGVAFTVYTPAAVVANYVTDGASEPYCLEELSSGQYNITRSVAENEVLTTSGDWAVTIAVGSVFIQEFGSYAALPTVAAGSAGAIAATPAPVALPPATATPAGSAGGRPFPIVPAVGLVIALLILATVLILLVVVIGRRDDQ